MLGNLAIRLKIKPIKQHLTGDVALRSNWDIVVLLWKTDWFHILSKANWG